MSFIGQYGYVRYYKGIHKALWFPLVEGPCEVPGCAEYQTAVETYYRKLKDETNGMQEKYDHPENARIYVPRKRPAIVIEHCHRHRWIRGFACHSCNTAIGHIETTGLPPMPNIVGVPRPDYKAFLMNCPECAGRPAPEPQSYRKPFQIPGECPICHGDKILPPAAFGSNCTEPGPCYHCDGTGLAILTKGKCEYCGKIRIITDERTDSCEECYDILLDGDYDWTDALDDCGPWITLADLSH